MTELSACKGEMEKGGLGGKTKPNICLRCGKCCIIHYKNMKKPCKYLEFVKGKANCKIYNHRIGAICATWRNINFYCVARENHPNDFIGCPYNTGKPILS